MSESNFKWAIAENVVIYLIVAILFWFTRSGWVFLFLIFVNTRIRPTPRAGDEGDSPASEPLSIPEVSPVEQAVSQPALRA